MTPISLTPPSRPTSRIGALLAMATLSVLGGFAQAKDAAHAAELAKAQGCLSCHAVAEKIVGPSYQDIGDKYAGVKDAPDTLAHSIRHGSIGKWGKRAAMPAHPSLSPEELSTLVNWVLRHKR